MKILFAKFLAKFPHLLLIVGGVIIAGTPLVSAQVQLGDAAAAESAPAIQSTGPLLLNVTEVAVEPPAVRGVASPVVNFKDSDLRAEINRFLNLSNVRRLRGEATRALNAAITEYDMKWIGVLNVRNKNIDSLTGMRYATNMTGFYADNNRISSISDLSDLTKLTALGLGENRISSISDLSDLTKLTWLRLDNNRISSISGLSDLTKLTWLRLDNNRISSISGLSDLTKLTTLDLGINNISSISALSTLTDLTHLYLALNAINNISALSGLTRLTYLQLGGNAITDISPLTSNTGLGSGDTVHLWNSYGGIAYSNPLTYTSLFTHVNTLASSSRGVNVSVGSANLLVANSKAKTVYGNHQVGPLGRALAKPFIQEVSLARNRYFWTAIPWGTRGNVRQTNAIVGVPVTFAVTAGGGTLSATSDTTDTESQAKTTLTLGTTRVTNTVTATVTHGSNSHTETFSTNFLPRFTSDANLSTAENATAIGAITAVDDDSSDSVTLYTLNSGVDQSKFAITTSGALSFKTSPDYENPTDTGTNNTYVVSIRARSGVGARVLIVDQTVTVTVTDINEPPFTPAAPTVTAATATPTRLSVSWTAPTNTGKPPITGYDVQYRKTGITAWTSHAHTVTSTSATLTGLTAGTGYEVQVRAKNAEGTSDYSPSGTATTAANTAPVFTSAATFSVAENTTTVGTVIASDADSQDSITGYMLGGTDSAKFSITMTGELTFTVTPDYESPGDVSSSTPASAAHDNDYVLVVTATSGTGGRVLTATQRLTITVTDVNEPPGTPDALTVTAAVATPRTLSVSWTASTNTGPALSYQVRYRVGSTGNFIPLSRPFTSTSITLTGLTPDTRYEVQVRARNAEGDSPWSSSGSATTAANVAPVFTNSAVFSVAENTTSVGTVVAFGCG